MWEKLLLKKFFFIGSFLIFFNIFFSNLALCALGGLDTTASQAGYEESKIEETAGSVVAIAISMVGVIFFIIIIIGGLTWMTSGGNETKIEKAKKMIIAGFIGLAVVLFAYAITYSLADLI